MNDAYEEKIIAAFEEWERESNGGYVANRARNEHKELFSCGYDAACEADTRLFQRALKALENVRSLHPIGTDDDYCETAWVRHKSVMTALRKRIEERKDEQL